MNCSRSWAVSRGRLPRVKVALVATPILGANNRNTRGRQLAVRAAPRRGVHQHGELVAGGRHQVERHLLKPALQSQGWSDVGLVEDAARNGQQVAKASAD